MELKTGIVFTLYIIVIGYCFILAKSKIDKKEKKVNHIYKVLYPAAIGGGIVLTILRSLTRGIICLSILLTIATIVNLNQVKEE